MTEKNESSVTFSLAELIKIEEQRTVAEAHERAQKQQASARAIAEKEERARLAAAEQIEATERRRQRQQIERKMEAAEIEGAKLAAIEATKMATHARIRADEIKQQQAFELQLAQVQALAKKRTSPWIYAGFAALTIAVAGAGVFGLVLKPRADAAALIKQASALACQKDESQLQVGLQKIAQAEALCATCAGLADVRAKLEQGLWDVQNARETEYAKKLKAAQDALWVLQNTPSEPAASASIKPANPPPDPKKPVAPPIVHIEHKDTQVTKPTCPVGVPLSGCP
jgi:hypothetical protein